ncbi:hypothetical protein PR202_gb07107 [Eleusine coracana subsp. coracana]|uniref:Pentatricopeptide repeat-containing protein n=1 Tax=Eleusine coracana subsp. coracana TaxID=191504 RepID=A0AAV5E8V7_ELECO|nr:hypothetical protein PR202_gb07107 [Eleusine coracana subsp. coracana]
MASSSLLAATRRLLRLGRGRSRLLPGLLPRAAASSPCGYSTEKRRPARPLGLQSTLSPLGHPGTLLVPEIELWAARPGNHIRPVELQRIVKELRKRRRHRQALEVGTAICPPPVSSAPRLLGPVGARKAFHEMLCCKYIPFFSVVKCKHSSIISFYHTFTQISEWMNAKGHVKFVPRDHAVHLDLVGQVHGIEAAETYFNNLSEKDKTEKTYGALLNCYTRELLVDKALAHFQKMKELGFVFSPLSYNNIMGLYTNLGQHEKVPSVIAEMKSNGIIPDNFSYRICINSYGTKADFFGMENTLEEMECEPQIAVDWNTYAVVASNYIKGDLREKAYSALQKAEAKIDKKDPDAYNHLISLYGQLGDKSEVKRLWALQMSNCKRHINHDYNTMLATLVKLDEIAEAEALLKEWESSGNSFDFHVPNVLLVGYRQKGLLDKAEMLLDNFLKKGKQPPSSSWTIVAIGYVEKGDAAKAYEMMKNALRVYNPDSGWVPRSSMIEMILKYLGDEVELKDVESFIDLLKVAVPMNSEMTEALSRARARQEKKSEEVG